MAAPCAGNAGHRGLVAQAAALGPLLWLTLAGGLVAGCASQGYEARPIDPQAAQAAWQSATVDDDATRQALSAQGIDTTRWPMSAWDAPALTALAWLRHPEMAQARAELRQAEAARAVAQQSPARSGEVSAQHHSDASNRSPWTLGVVVDGLFSGAAQGDARSDEAEALATEAVHNAAQTAWQVRQRVRTALRSLSFATAQERLAQQQLAQRRDLAAAAQRRLDRGAIDAREALLARQAESEAQQQRVQAQDAQRRARSGLAAALALPLAQLEPLPLRLDPIEPAPPPVALPELQGAALLNRLDVRAALARYAVADARLRLELARQWPDLVLRPGAQWDQGDRIWSLGLGITWPPGGRNQAAIAAAQAQRETEAARFAVVQTAALSALDAAAAQAASAQALSEASRARWADAQQAAQRSERRLAAGDADQPEALAAAIAASDAQRQWLEAQAASWAAHDALEDAVQRPLDAPGAAGRTRLSTVASSISTTSTPSVTPKAHRPLPPTQAARTP